MPRGLGDMNHTHHPPICLWAGW